MNTSIVAAGHSFDIGCRVVLWHESNGLSFYPNKKLTFRSKSFAQLQQEIRLFVLHHSVTYTALETFQVLIRRNLSVNFIIDDDNEQGCATIYQCADILDACYSQGEYNLWGPGVEISYRPEAWKNSRLYTDDIIYQKHLEPHPIIQDIIHGQKMQVFAPSSAQINSATSLAWGMCELFPKIKPEFPKLNGKIIKTQVSSNKLTGLACHYHLTNKKIDPLGIDLTAMEKEVQLMLKVGY